MNVVFLIPASPWMIIGGADEESRQPIPIGANAWIQSPRILHLGAALLLLIPAMVVLGPIDPGAESQHDKEHGLFRHPGRGL